MSAQFISRKILIVATNDSGGAGTAMYRMFLGLKELGYNVRFLVKHKSLNNDEIIDFKKNKKNDYINKFINICLRFLNINLQKSFQTNFDYYFFNKYEKQFDSVLESYNLNIDFIPDIIIGTWISGFFNLKSIGLLANKYNSKLYLLMNDMAHLTGGCHYAWDCNGYLKDCNNCPAIIEDNYKDIARLNLIEKRKSIEKFKIKLIAGSQSTYSQAKKSLLFNNQEEIQIFNGLIDFKTFNPLKRKIARQVFDLQIGTKIIFCGALDFNEKRKGFKELKDVLTSLSTMEISIKNEIIVMMIGRKMENLNIPNLKFKFIDHIKDQLLFSLAYQACDVYVSPSIEDSGPMMVVESLACGTPVVGFDIGFVNSLISNGENGFKIKSFDTQCMSEKISEILSLKSNFFVESCFKSVNDKFSLNNLNKIFQKL
jgi:glycosyltransferase involved in cell wall biosynthesis